MLILLVHWCVVFCTYWTRIRFKLRYTTITNKIKSLRFWISHSPKLTDAVSNDRVKIQFWILVWWICPRCRGHLPDTQNCGLRMRRECRERFLHHRLQRKLVVSDPGMHHGTCVKHVPWCMSGSLTSGGRANVPGIPGAGATRNFAYLVRGPLSLYIHGLLADCKHCYSKPSRVSGK